MNSKIPKRCKQCKHCTGEFPYFCDVLAHGRTAAEGGYGPAFWNSWMRRCEIRGFFEWDDKLTKYDFEEREESLQQIAENSSRKIQLEEETEKRG